MGKKNFITVAKADVSSSRSNSRGAGGLRVGLVHKSTRIKLACGLVQLGSEAVFFFFFSLELSPAHRNSVGYV